MSGREFKTGEFDARLRSAVRRALDAHGSFDTRTGTVLADALFVGFKVMIDELAGEQDAAPPVRELPTEPGAVVLASGLEDWPSQRYFMRTCLNNGEEWRYFGDDGYMRWTSAATMADLDWQPATVVPTAVHEAAVKALRDVVELLNGPQSGDVQEAQDAAINALAGIEGWAGL